VARVISLTPGQPHQPRQPKPEWLKVRAPGSPSYLRLKALMRDLGLHTVCEEAQCPNIGECWNHGTATFMILGDVCTRACSYCAVSHGRPDAVDVAEPARVAEAIKTLDLSYVVITSVDRDDLDDGGASMFAATIRETRRRLPECRIEVLIPDFQGNEAALRDVAAGMLCDQVASAVVPDPSVRQRLLEELDIEKRLGMLATALDDLYTQLTGDR